MVLNRNKMSCPWAVRGPPWELELLFYPKGTNLHCQGCEDKAPLASTHNTERPLTSAAAQHIRAADLTRRPLKIRKPVGRDGRHLRKISRATMKWVGKAATMPQKYKRGDGIRRDERWKRNQTLRPKKQNQEELMREGLMKEEEELPPETPQQTKPCPSSISLFVLASAFCSGGLELMILLLQPPEC